MAHPFLRIGTRGSALALAQAHETRARLSAAHGVPEDEFEVVVIKTSGDAILDRPLSEVGGKGLFTKEIEDALLDRRIDLAVHSSKDMPTELPDGLAMVAYLEREDVRDAFIGHRVRRLIDLPQGAAVGSSSLRRQAQIRRLRPDLQVGMFRGNVQTRLSKVGDGQVAGTLLAYAGLKRLGLTDRVSEILAVDDFLPAVGQGAIGIEARTDDDRTRELLSPLNHPPTQVALTAERAFLKVLDGSCRTPIAGHARLIDDRLSFEGLILRPDGSESHGTTRLGAIAEAEALGQDAGQELKARAPGNFFHA